MSSCRGPRLRKISHLGALPGLTIKTPKSGSNQKKKFHAGKKEQYRIHLQEKQKLWFHYGLTERQLLRYVHIARKAKRSTGQVLLQLLEMCLDNILFRLVNGHIVDIPSFRCKPRDIIDNQRSKRLVQNSIASSDPGKLPKHLTVDTLQYKGLVKKILDRKWVGLKVNEFLVVEYYSCQTKF
ncbi:hypothetical protein PAHAL_8G181700 [Panicum hallii]|uniref:Small ribosomal subunit protein uS4c n=1 Tax=Panicum hallii TaxID=206008 RepID=A0A2T8I9B1_9POAL|nr:hypothetical protein PAHAL_8G181700 [Panicum hallii]